MLPNEIQGWDSAITSIPAVPGGERAFPGYSVPGRLEGSHLSSPCWLQRIPGWEDVQLSQAGVTWCHHLSRDRDQPFHGHSSQQTPAMPWDKAPAPLLLLRRSRHHEAPPSQRQSLITLQSFNKHKGICMHRLCEE